MLPPTTCQPTRPLTSPTITALLNSLLNTTTYTPKLTAALLTPGLFKDDTLPSTSTLLLEAARLANQLVEDLIAFDTEGLRDACGVSRLTILRCGVNARAFVEMYEAFVRDCVDGAVCDGGTGKEKEMVVRGRGFLGFWRALEREVNGLVELLV